MNNPNEERNALPLPDVPEVQGDKTTGCGSCRAKMAQATFDKFNYSEYLKKSEDEQWDFVQVNFDKTYSYRDEAISECCKECPEDY